MSEIGSTLGQIANLETKNSELSGTASELESENRALKEKLEKYTAAQREKMKSELDTVISDWIKSIDVTDEKVKQDFLAGMENIVKQTKEDSGVWQIMCCASKAHQSNVNKLNEITEKYNLLQKQIDGGTFRSEDARVLKRPREEEAPRTVWDEFEASMRGGAVSAYVPDPETVRALRAEWKPLHA